MSLFFYVFSGLIRRFTVISQALRNAVVVVRVVRLSNKLYTVLRSLVLKFLRERGYTRCSFGPPFLGCDAVYFFCHRKRKDPRHEAVSHFARAWVFR